MNDIIGSLHNTMTISDGDTDLTVEIFDLNLRIVFRDRETGSGSSIILDAEDTKMFRTVLTNYANRIRKIVNT